MATKQALLALADFMREYKIAIGTIPEHIWTTESGIEILIDGKPLRFDFNQLELSHGHLRPEDIEQAANEIEDEPQSPYGETNKWEE